MKLTRIIGKLILLFFYFFKFRNVRLAFHLANNNVSQRRCKNVIKEGNQLYFQATNSSLPIYLCNKYFKDSLHYIIDIFNCVTITDIKESNNGVILSASGISYYVNNESNAGNFYEILCRQMYEYDSSSTDIIVLDIGMNSGLASLFFASKEFVNRVYSYEPFPSTVKDAQENFRLNKLFSEKIIVTNAGISNKNATVSVPFFETGAMQASVNEDFINRYHTNIQRSQNTIEIQLRDIKEVILEIIETENIIGDRKLVLKIDCEGEEYNIIERLNECNLLNKISAFLIEWHQDGPAPLMKTLRNNNFHLLTIPITTIDGAIISEAGMLYAFR